MADGLPDPQEMGGAIWAHDWYSWENYQTVHASHMARLEDEGLIMEDRLAIEEVTDNGELVSVFIRGRIKCCDDVVIQVDKELDVRRSTGGYAVKGSEYAYHAWIEATGQDII